MKRYILVFAALFSFCGAFAQYWCNAEAMYDFGHKHGTITVEGQHFDKVGNGYGFIDLDCDLIAGQSGAYCEYGYNFGILKGFSARIEYNGGVAFDNGYTYAHGALIGLSYTALCHQHAFETQVQYRMDIDYQTKSIGHGLQVSQIWSCNWFNSRLWFRGCVDINIRNKNVQFNTEPQLVYRFGDFGIGGEVEIENWIGKMQAYPKAVVLVWL